jgi:hypothetical protein
MPQSALIGNWSTTNITNSATMSIAFWINISTTNTNWRNIFHVSNQNIDCCDSGNRLPAMWICPGNTQLYVRHSTSTNGDDGPGCSSYQVPLNTNVFITVVFNSTTMVLYANAISQQTYTYSSPLISADSTASFYMADPWYSYGGFQIKNFTFYNSVFSSSDVINLYNEESGADLPPLNLYPLINGTNDLYNPIYCNNLVPTNTNFITCENCNFGSGTVTNTSTQSGEQNCLNACDSNDMCTSYTYDLSESSNNCIQYSSFPSEILGGVNNVNSGYSLNFGYDYNSLSSSQQENVQTKCANQYLNNTFLQNNNIDLESCLTVENNSGTTNFNVDPQCLFNIYETNDLNPTVVNNATYTVNSDYTSPQSDTIIDNYEYDYDNYMTQQIQKSNLSNNLEPGWMLKDSNKTYQQNLNQQNNTLKTDYVNSLQDIKKNELTYVNNVRNTIIENFNNDSKKKNNVLMLIFIFILVIFMYYILRKIK